MTLHRNAFNAARRHILAGVVAAAVLSPMAAFAHAHLDRSTPAAGSTGPAPTEVTLWFTEALEPKFSTIEVRDAKGVAVHTGKATPGPDNTAELRVAVHPLPPGRYQVIWRILSVDTHRTSGEFAFTVAP